MGISTVCNKIGFNLANKVYVVPSVNHHHHHAV